MIDRVAVVGRLPDCDVVVPDGLVSGRHLSVAPSDDGVRIKDLGSSNGTFISGERVTAPRVLTENTTVQIGAVAITLVREGGSSTGGQCFVVAQSGRRMLGLAWSPSVRPVRFLLRHAVPEVYRGRGWLGRPGQQHMAGRYLRKALQC